jgi:hypothetical protein
MKKLLYNFLIKFVSKETLLNIEMIKFSLEKDFNKEKVGLEDRVRSTSWYTKQDLTTTEKELFYKKAEIKSINDSIKVKQLELTIQSEKDAITISEQQKRINNLVIEKDSLLKIIDNLVRQIAPQKVEIIKT